MMVTVLIEQLVILLRMQVVVGYSKPKYFHLTPSRKKIGRILGRGNKSSLASIVLGPENMGLRKNVVRGVGKLMHQEFKFLCADSFPSMLRDTSDVALEHFSWESLWIEISRKAPTFVSVLESSLPAKTKLDKRPVLGMCAAMLAKFRNPKMCHVQAAISLVLHAGHAGTQVSMNMHHFNWY